MRLDFNVLWVDDQPTSVQAQIDAIAGRMAAEGFQFHPRVCRSLEEVRAAISTNVFTDEVDMILVDWDLGMGVQGQKVITEIRSELQYKDVVFYSARTVPDELKKFAFQVGLEGVFCAGREELVEEVMGVFESLVKKVLDLDHTRGIVMGATSDIDHMANECLVAIHRKLEQAGQKAMIAEALGYIDRRIEALTEQAAKLKGAANLVELFEAHMVLTAYDRLRMLGGALKADAFKAQKKYRPHVVTYQQKVTRERNILGHMVLVPEGKPQTVIGSEGTPIGLDQTRELRRLILDLRGEFRALLAELQAAG